MNRAVFHRALAPLALLLLAACSGAKPVATVPVAERAQIEADMRRDIEILSGEDFGGRKPGTLGEEKTLAFITEELQKAGLVSGTNDPGSDWRAPVKLVSTQPFTSSIVIRAGRRTTEIDAAAATALTTRRRELVDGQPLVFVGKGADPLPDETVAGKIIVMLSEPGESPQRRGALFKQSPAAILTVVDDADSIAQVNRAYGNERVTLESDARDALSAFITAEAMGKAMGERTWARLVESSAKDDFTPVTLQATAKIEATSQRQEFTSYNIIGKIPGQVPGSGAIVLMGHWDHLGECGAADAEDRLCNGAVDNASGIAMMLELTRRLKAGGVYDRDIYVLATSAEESGLLGARAFVDAPPIPLESIVGVFNFDTVAVAPAGSAVGFIGEGQTPLNDLILRTLEEAGRKLGDKDYARQFEARQDGWVFTQKGVPAVMLSTAFGSAMTLGPFLETDYHRASDEVDAIVLGGAIDDLLLHEEIIRRVASTAVYTPPPSE